MMSNLMMAPLMETKPPPAPFHPAIESKKSIRRNLFDSSPKESNVDTLLWEKQEEDKEYLWQRYNIDLPWLEEQEEKQLNKCNKTPISANPKNEQKYSPYRRPEGIKRYLQVRKIVKQPAVVLQQKQCNNNNINSSNNNNNNKSSNNNNNNKETAVDSHNSKMGETNGQQQKKSEKVEKAEVQEVAAAKGEVEEAEVAAAKEEVEEEAEAEAEQQQRQ